MGSWHSYPKIFALGHKQLQMLLTGEVVIQEKVDGSQFSFCRMEDRLLIRSKGVEQNLKSPDKMFQLIVDYVKSIKDKLIDGWTYRGEYLNKPNHNTICYDRVPKNNFVLFDIEIQDQHFLPVPAVTKEADRLGFDSIPTYYIGPGKDVNVEKLHEYLKLDSFLGKVKIEGVVIKNYDQYGADKKVLLGKFVSVDFQEAHGNEWTAKNPCPSDFMEKLGSQYCTTARWQKAVQRLRDSGKFTQSLQDIGPLLTSVKEDVLEECRDAMKDALFGHFWKSISRGLTKGLPEWYKEELVKQQFIEVEVSNPGHSAVLPTLNEKTDEADGGYLEHG